MNKTANYQLNQWVKSDRVLMEDFNADNAKIDAALKANASAISAETSARISAVQAEASARASAVQAARDACPLVTLRTVTLTQDTDQFDLDLTGFDWNAYGEVIIYACLQTSGFVQVLLNGQSGQEYYTDNGSWEFLLGQSIYHRKTLLVCRVPWADTGFTSVWQNGRAWKAFIGSSSSQTSLPRSEFKTMNFLARLYAGTRFTILGVKA